jgi:hypothetical protein
MKAIFLAERQAKIGRIIHSITIHEQWTGDIVFSLYGYKGIILGLEPGGIIKLECPRKPDICRSVTRIQHALHD